MRLVYFGTPEPAIPPLDALLESSHEIAAVVTRPDRARNHAGGRPSPSPVKRRALERGLPVLEPAGGRERGLAAALAAFNADLGVTCAYGSLLSRAVLHAFPAGVVNLHFSLLPAYRGAAPVQRALLDGVSMTGVTTFLLDEGMDTGPLLLRREVRVDPDDDAGTLTQRLAAVGAPLLVATVDGIEGGSVLPEPQREAGASSAPRLQRDEARLDFSAPAGAVVARVRAFAPRPGAWTTLHGRRLKVLRARVAAGPLPRSTAAPGALTVTATGEPLVATGDGQVLLEQVQAEGRRMTSGAEFVRGARLQPGDLLGR